MKIIANEIEKLQTLVVKSKPIIQTQQYLTVPYNKKVSENFCRSIT